MPNYSNAKIYTIRSHQTDKIYVGSTTQKLSTRMGEHRRIYKKWKAGVAKMNVRSVYILQYEDAYIELLESFPCSNRTELNRREGYYIRNNKELCTNCAIAGRTQKEYQQDHKVELKEYRKQYYQTNKEKSKAYQTQYRQNNKDRVEAYRKVKYTCGCGSIITKHHKSRHELSAKHLKWEYSQRNFP